MFSETPQSIFQKIWQINWMLVVMLCVLAGVGFMVLYSAAGGSWDPWAGQQLTRFMGGLFLMCLVAVIDIKIWIRFAYVFYLGALVLLIGVEIMGVTAKGAQRWLEIGGMRLQPSELMKVALVMALARYFHTLREEDARHLKTLVIPALIMVVPFLLVLHQPDLGTAGLLILTAVPMFYAIGVPNRFFIIAGTLFVIALPLAWEFVLRDYQRQRVLTMIDPESDPLGAGYHIIQSKIALGSGGIFGKGFLNGSQARLNFLPEKQTDFIFTMFSEEFGLVGAILLIALYILITIYGYAIAFRAKSQFARLICLGVITTFFLYYFINMAMVMGVFPVVGVPLPLVSYGGTAMLSIMFGFGLVMNAWIHRDVQISRHDY